MRPRPPGDSNPPDDFSSLDETIDYPSDQLANDLARCVPFESLSGEILALLQSNMTEQQFGAGAFLMKQGDPGTSLMVLSAGEADVVVEEREKRYLLKRATAGEVLGEMALLTGEPRTASVIAVTPARAWVLAAERFETLARHHPRISTLLTLLLASRLGRATHDAMTGNVFAGYRIERCVGRGGMSVVYEAEESATRRQVALKMMSHRLLYDPVAMQRFKREAEIVESFDHPNIARTYGRFEAFRTSFIVMELCEGVSIDEALEKMRRLPEPIARKVLGQVACAVAHAHAAGVVHRDIKPSNLMATRDGTIKLIDFGLAGLQDDDLLTRSLYGTPCYMAPEQMSGGTLGMAVDLFALGHVAFEMVTGERLFKSHGFHDLREEVKACRIPDVARSFPHISPEYRGVLEGALKREPDQRRIDFALLQSWAGPVELEKLEHPPKG
jgi:CRP-like cAMP-binding protein